MLVWVLISGVETFIPDSPVKSPGVYYWISRVIEKSRQRFVMNRLTRGVRNITQRKKPRSIPAPPCHQK